METTKYILWAPEDRERCAAARMTGRYLITLSKGAEQLFAQKLVGLGFTAAKSPSLDAQSVRALPLRYFLIIDDTGIIVVDPAPDQRDGLRDLAEQDDSVVAVEPERIVRALGSAEISAGTAMPAPLTRDEAAWGLTVTRVVNSEFSGAQIRIAVLDTGLDLCHPDFAGRTIRTVNFVGDRMPFHDGNGHGTHMTGTAAGPRRPTQGPRYGIAGEAQIFSARVLDDTGHGGDANVLQGIKWAISQRCQIISLSLGTPWDQGDPPYCQAYETIARQALDAECLLICAAGNEADLPGVYVGAVATPGNSPSVLTVAALDTRLNTAPFSDRVESAAPGVKGPDLAAPGVGVYSSWLVAKGLYKMCDGTSAATSHVSGIAALYAQANPAIRSRDLKSLLLQTCAPLPDGAAPVGEIGKGLVRAP